MSEGSAYPVREYRTIDKSGWGTGPWQDEADKIQWVDDTTDLDCLIVRGPSGALCGYVGVPPSHLWHAVGYEDPISDADADAGCSWERARPESEVDVHGGLTYSGFCQEGTDPSQNVCHVPYPGRESRVWWFGFDCAHARDVTPAFDASARPLGLPRRLFAEYRTVSDVRREVESLAAQLASIEQSEQLK